MPEFKYPDPVKRESGCKVSWLYYDNIDVAIEAAKVAKREADHLARQGFDYGFQSPGSVVKKGDGLFEVCVP